MASGGRFASHDPRIVSVFEVVGSYFVDTLFNHVYQSAQTNLTGGSSLTDEYTRRLQAYVIGVKNDERCYEDIVRGVHQWFMSNTRFSTINFAGFVDRIVGVCIPEDYFRQCRSQDKDELLSSILCDLVANLAAFASKDEMLRRIIDNHNTESTVTVQMLKDAAINALLAKRTSLTNKFLKKLGQARDHVPADMLDSMKSALRKVVKEKAKLKAKLEEAEEAIAELRKDLQESKAREEKLRKLTNLLREGRTTEGAAAAGARLRTPARERLAEEADPLDLQDEGAHVPRREHIAEERGGRDESDDAGSSADASDSGDTSRESDTEGTEGSPPSDDRSKKRSRDVKRPHGKARRVPKGQAPAPHRGALPSSFFKTGGGSAAPQGSRAPLSKPSKSSTPSTPLAPPKPSTPLAPPNPPTPSKPAMLNLLEAAVDTSDDYLEDILRGGNS
jgi:hypothetical protein